LTGRPTTGKRTICLDFLVTLLTHVRR
jgi:hypothetical protein